MRETVSARLHGLREQLASGQQVMAELNRKQDELRATLLRISGAIQVLEELLGSGAGSASPAERGGQAGAP